MPASPGSGRRRRRTLIVAGALFLLAVATCGAVILLSPFPKVEFDAATYLALARNIALGNGFTVDGLRPYVFTPPLFSGLLGLWFAATGTSSALSAAWFQTLLHGLGVVASFLLFLELLPSLAWAAGFATFLAVNPILVTRVVFVLQETTLLAFTTLACLATVVLLKRPTAARAAVTGAAWGLCILAKVVCWFAPLLLLALRVLPRRSGWAWRPREALLLLLCCVAVVAPWTARNFIGFNRFIPVNGQVGGVLDWKVEHADIPGEPPGIAVRDGILKDYPDENSRKAAFWRYIAAHPRHFSVDQVIESALHYAALPRDWWILVGGRRPHEHDGEYWLLFGVCYLPFYLALLRRVGQLVRSALRPGQAFLVLFFLASWAQYALLWGDPRYNVPLYPLLIGMALPLCRGAEAPAAASARDEDEHLSQAERAQPPPAGGPVERA